MQPVGIPSCWLAYGIPTNLAEERPSQIRTTLRVKDTWTVPEMLGSFGEYCEPDPVLPATANDCYLHGKRYNYLLYLEDSNL